MRIGPDYALLILRGPHGRVGSLYVQFDGHNPEGRPSYHYWLSDREPRVIDDGVFGLGTGDEPDVTAAMRTLLGFLIAAGESYRRTMQGPESDNAGLFSSDAMLWAYEHAEEIESALGELEGPGRGLG